MYVGGGHEVWIGVGCPCPPVRYEIVTPRHLFFFSYLVFSLVFFSLSESHRLYKYLCFFSPHYKLVIIVHLDFFLIFQFSWVMSNFPISLPWFFHNRKFRVRVDKFHDCHCNLLLCGTKAAGAIWSYYFPHHSLVMSSVIRLQCCRGFPHFILVYFSPLCSITTTCFRFRVNENGYQENCFPLDGFG